MYFHYFVIITPWKRAGPFIWRNVKPLYPRMLWTKFGWNWPSGFGEDFFNFVNVFSLFRNYLPLEKGGPFIWTNLNPLHPRMLCAKFGCNWLSGSEEEDFLISLMYFRFFVIISPWKRVGPFIWRNLNPLYPRIRCFKFGWNWPSGSGEEDEKFSTTTTDNAQILIRKAHLSFWLRWAKI